MIDRRRQRRPVPAAGIELLEARHMMAADPVISEFVSANEGGFADGFGRSPDWIEIWNRGDTTVNLNGYSLSDDPQQPELWRFPDLNLAAGEYLVVFASGAAVQPTVDPNDGLHTNFRLDRDGGYLELRAPGGAVASRFGTADTDYPSQLVNVSYGIGQASGKVGYMQTPTPGAANVADDAVLADFVRDTKYSVDRGFFDQPFPLTISTATPGATIRYTLDGTEPSLTRGETFTNPITISQTSIVRAVAFRDDYVPTNIDTQTYLFLDNVLTQDGAGFSGYLGCLSVWQFRSAARGAGSGQLWNGS